ncbi:MAG TPA: hypothetical protein VGR66_07255 [Candidatus Eisenbacteria bacterium]|nr:hypothetical protein [Candidatus Eisenbacteria bacterium]
MRLPLRWSVSTLIALALLAPVAHAQGKMDTPIVRQVDSSRSSLTLEVQAGASGAPAGFRVQWMKLSDYTANGGWPSDPNSPLLSRAQFYGNPTWNVSSGTYLLQSDGTITIELGDLFDETGVLTNNLSELGDQQPYVVRAQAVGYGSDAASDVSPDLDATTKPAAQNCTFTQGYWKNHPAVWPVSSLTLGTVTYTAAQLLQILNQPAKGNGLIILAHQLIAAKLNIAGGADPTPVASVIADADALIGSLVVPPIGSGYLNPDDTDTDSQALDAYNNGNSGVPHCGQVPTHAATWGQLKGMYR